MDSGEDHDLVFSSSGEKVDGNEDDADKNVVECADTCEKQDDEDVVEEKIMESVNTSEKQDSEDVVVESIDTSDEQDFKDLIDDKVVESDDLYCVEFDIFKKQAIVEDMTELTSATPKEEKQAAYPIIIGSVECGMCQVSVSSTPCCIDREECLPTTPGKDATDVVNGSDNIEQPLSSAGEEENICNNELTEVGDTNTSSKSETTQPVGELRGASTLWGNKPNFTSARVVENVLRQPIVRQSFLRDNDDKIGENIGFALLELDEMNRRRDVVRMEVETKKITSKECRDKYEAAKYVQSVAYDVLNAKRQELDSVQSTLNMIKNALLVKETSDKVRAIQYRLEHETIYSIQEEKQLMREMKQLTVYHQELRSIVERQTEPQPSSDEKKPLEKKLMALKEEFDSAKKELSRIKSITDVARKMYFDENEKLKEMQGQFKYANMLCQEAYANVQNLKRQLNKNKYFRMYKDDDFKNKYLRSNPTSTHALNAARRKVEENKVVAPSAPTEIKPALHSQKMLKEENKHDEEEEELPRDEKKVLPKENVVKTREELVAEERTKAKETKERKKRNAEKAKDRAELMEQREAERKSKKKAKRDRKKARKAGIIEGESLDPISEDLSLEQPVTQEIPEISEKPTVTQEILETKKKPRSKKYKKPLVLGKTNIVAPPLLNKKKKPAQLWKWVILSAPLVVAAVVACLADPLHILL